MVKFKMCEEFIHSSEFNDFYAHAKEGDQVTERENLVEKWR
jgi:hypothetical protein